MKKVIDEDLCPNKEEKVQANIIKEEGGNNMIQKTFDADREVLHEVLAFIEGELEKNDCNMKTQMIISVMVEEMFVNVASYAYPNTKGTCTIGIEFEGDDVIISLVDSGIPFDPLAKEDPDITLSAEERDIGGLGIYMVKQTMDDVRYERVNDENHFIFRKGIH